MSPSHPLLERAAAAIFVALLLGCATTAPPASTLAEPSTKDGARPTLRCRLTATEAQGCGATEVESLLEPARVRLERCLGPTGGKIRVRVRDVNGKLAFEIEPGSSLDIMQRQCVLEALATIHDETSSPSTGATVRPTGFTSLLTIDW